MAGFPSQSVDVVGWGHWAVLPVPPEWVQESVFFALPGWHGVPSFVGEASLVFDHACSMTIEGRLVSDHASSSVPPKWMEKSVLANPPGRIGVSSFVGEASLALEPACPIATEWNLVLDLWTRRLVSQHLCRWAVSLHPCPRLFQSTHS